MISTHAPARGATIKSSYTVQRIIFQPTLPRGERRLPGSCGYSVSPISTHAPARGATLPLLLKRHKNQISTHAPARGATSRNGRPGKYLLFQPTLPRGERRFCLSTLKNIVLFQPTLPRGERHLPLLLKRHKNQISTHAPARGATTQIWITTRGLQISTHAPARGATISVDKIIN